MARSVFLFAAGFGWIAYIYRTAMRPGLRGADSMTSPKRRKNDDEQEPPDTEEPASLASVESYPRKRISVAVSPAERLDCGTKCGSASAI